MLKPIREYEYSFREGLKEILLNRKEPYLYLSANPNAIPILEKNLDKVNWSSLSRNPNAIPILKNLLKNKSH
jgi:hypothetical protein